MKKETKKQVSKKVTIEVGAAAMHVPYHVTWQLEHAEEFTHERLVRADGFADVLRCIER